jgi:hypothetical protein
MRQPLDLEILRKGRRETVLHADADPDDLSGLRDHLCGWLAGHGWDKGRWGEFELVGRLSGEGKVLARVRA